jgi:hypothetical protein
MLATLVDESLDDKRWVFETKWDGFRLITEKRSSQVVVAQWRRHDYKVRGASPSASKDRRFLCPPGPNIKLIAEI